MELTTTTRVATPLTLALVLLSITRRCDAYNSLKGTRQTCSNEDEEFPVNNILNMGCYKCICKNGFVECRNYCPSLEGCYALEERPGGAQYCKGCVKNSIHHESGTEWTEPNDPCRMLSCKAGVITESMLRCYTPCTNPKPPTKGQCCPTCPGCYVNGQKATAERTVTIADDPCVTCRCTEGRLTCAKQACPVYNCPHSKIVSNTSLLIDDECCPHCVGKGKYLSPPKGACLINQEVYKSGTTFTIDDCTQCTCANSKISCVRQTCPVMDCPKMYQVHSKGRCCPQCSIVEESRASCSYGGRTYQDGEFWQLDACKTCECKQGNVHCAMPKCPPISPVCPRNSKLEQPEGQCCPQCVETHGVCSALNDGHFKTFDGKSYLFKGRCKYQLVNDCAKNLFSVKFAFIRDRQRKEPNDGKWIKPKTVALKVGNMRVNLGQRLRVKVNRNKVNVPYRSNQLDISRTAHNTVVVNTTIGMQIEWDGHGLIHVTVVPSYRGRVCGLCGNYNSSPKDDFNDRHGILLEDVPSFAQSWAVGSNNKKCSKTHDHNKNCRNPQNRKSCRWLTSEMFSSCRKIVSPKFYKIACRQDMCNCPTKKCYCQSLSAYTSECKRWGISLTDWRNTTKCHSAWEPATPPKVPVRQHQLPLIF